MPKSNERITDIQIGKRESQIHADVVKKLFYEINWYFTKSHDRSFRMGKRLALPWTSDHIKQVFALIVAPTLIKAHVILSLVEKIQAQSLIEAQSPIQAA